MEDKLKINIVKTDTCCFISDCNATSGYDYNYFHPQVDKMLFDGECPTPTFYPNWFKIKKYPELVQQKIAGQRINCRYEIKNKNLISDQLPMVIPYEDRDNHESEVLDSLYEYEYDIDEPTLENIDCEFSVVCEINNFEEPVKFDYEAVHKYDYSDKVYHITNVNIKHQLFDKMIFPEVVLHNRPCSLSSKEVYDITRQYVREHIDNSKAKITSDYDFCFDVKKIIPLIEPETISYQNIFARTKKERNKINYSVKKCNEVSIFSMTNKQENYKGYTAIDNIIANSEVELKDKLDEWLTTLINQINKPLELCSHCNGTGYKGEVKSIDKTKIIEDINKN